MQDFQEATTPDSAVEGTRGHTDDDIVLCRNCGIELCWHDDADEPEGYWVHAPEVLFTSCGQAQP